jgi:hypothetical protein
LLSWSGYRAVTAERLMAIGILLIALLVLALFAEMERTFTAERAAHARSVAETQRPPGRPSARAPRRQGR